MKQISGKARVGGWYSRCSLCHYGVPPSIENERFALCYYRRHASQSARKLVAGRWALVLIEMHHACGGD